MSPVAPPVSPALIDGPVHKVPCPWCGRPNDLRELQSQLGQSFEPGCTYECDHCKNIIKVTRVVPTAIVQVKQHGQQRAAIPAPPMKR